MAGYVHIYTGNGKGKTTAAFGLAVRALYAEKSVYIGQFIKGMKYNETGLEKDFERLVIEQYGETCMIDREPDENDLKMAQEGLDKMKAVIKAYDVVIFDEVTIALYYKLITLEELFEVLALKPENTEVVITGRYAPDALIEYADLVTEMKEVKHYYTQGVLSRDGIDK